MHQLLDRAGRPASWIEVGVQDVVHSGREELLEVSVVNRD
jgi:hypothetical protein